MRIYKIIFGNLRKIVIHVARGLPVEQTILREVNHVSNRNYLKEGNSNISSHRKIKTMKVGSKHPI